MNSAGQVVGWEAAAPERHSKVRQHLLVRPMIWRNGQASTPVSYSFEVATGINDAGRVIGNAGQLMEAGLGGADLLNMMVPFYGLSWSGGGRTEIPGDHQPNTLHGINKEGMIVGEYGGKAALWKSADAPAPDQLPLAPDCAYGVGYAVNDTGEVVGAMSKSEWSAETDGRPFSWVGGHLRLLALGSPPGLDSPSLKDARWPDAGIADAVNAGGTVAGCVIYGKAWQAALWTPEGDLHLLPNLSGYPCSRANGIDGAGVAVGSASAIATLFPTLFPTQRSMDEYGLDAPICRRACLWKKRKAYDLNTLIPPKSGWTLGTATAINEKGEIVGGGVIHGEYHAFLLKPVHTPGRNPGG